jgi:hypothetical protein
MEKFMSEYADIIIPFLGVVSAFLLWMQYRTQVRLRDKDATLENIENNQIKIQSDADQARIRDENTQKLIEGIFRGEERWQKVMDVNSERRLEEGRLKRESDTLLASSIDRQAAATLELKNVLEIQIGVLGNVKSKVEDSLHTFVASAAATHKAVDSQKEELTLVNKSIGNLAMRIDDLIAIDETHVLDEGKRHDNLRDDNREHKAELVAIKDALQTSNGILENILKRMANNTQPIPLPTPETWNEDTEATVIIPPKKLVDEDGNVKPLPHAVDPKPDNEDNERKSA